MASEIRVNKLNSQTGVGTITLSPTGVDISGITTAATLKVGTGATVSSDGDAFFTGVCTATSFVGSGANLTGISGVSVANQSDNRLITATGTTDALNGESGATYDGTDFTVSSGRLKLTDESSGDQIRIGAAGDFTIEHDGSNTYLKNTTGNVAIQNDNNVEITAKTGGTKRFRFDSDGLKFGSDTAAANALDDYEEGTFNPTMANSITLHSGSDTLSYVKVGHLVHVTGVLRINSGNSSSDISITNMPFATVNSAESSGNAIGAVSLYDLNMNSGYSQVLCVMNPNSTQLNVVLQTQSGSQQLGLDASDNGYFGVSICYRSA